MQFAKLLEDAFSRLKQAGVENARGDAIMLLGFCFDMTRSQLFLAAPKEVPGSELERFNALLERRIAREPLHYITGTREFWSLDFIVSPAVLVPRPETEFVLDTIVSTVRKDGFTHGPLLDMCTGSGVIAVVLARELNADNVVAVDSSEDALQVAAQNVKKFGLSGSIALVCSDLFDALQQDLKYEIIVANPPYVSEGDMGGLEPEVRDWEPRSALTAGDQGMDVIRRIAEQSCRHLVPGGWLFIEIGSDQKEKVEMLFTGEQTHKYERAVVLSDWSGRPRLLQVKKRGW